MNGFAANCADFFSQLLLPVSRITKSWRPSRRTRQVGEKEDTVILCRSRIVLGCSAAVTLPLLLSLSLLLLFVVVVVVVIIIVIVIIIIPDCNLSGAVIHLLLVIQ